MSTLQCCKGISADKFERTPPSMFESVALYLHHEYLSFILPAYAVCMPAAKNMAHVEGTLYSEEMME